MGKNKLARWNELETFSNVIQPLIEEIKSEEPGELKVRNHPVKGQWRETIFRNQNPVVLELGCGRGEYTIGLATRFPGKNFIGVDIKGARLWRGAKTSNEKNIANAAFLRTRIEFINAFFENDEADELWITFPDPHPGTRNANKRLTSPYYLNSYRSLLKDNGIVHLKTDNTELFRFTRQVAISNNLELLFDTEDLYGSGISDDILSIKTHYEKMFLGMGMKINYLAFRLPKLTSIVYETR
ncbi:MAG TPA: tRNA (guanosine(46)-N7)-methyltransferase TrmB [Bacteroidales bacterium]|nr:tRNA (guanosine(46)-N7)-methyltransferase TrmB [Bacteroidales bacterium]